MLDTLIYISLTIITTLFIQKQKIFDSVFFLPFLKDMRKCQICLGYWVALVYHFVFDVGILDRYYSIHVMNSWIDPLLTSMVVTLIAYYLTEGIKNIHLITIIK